MSGIILEKLLIMMIMGLIGFICGKTGLIDGDTNKRLSNLSLLVVNPLLIFVSYQMPYSGDIAVNLGIVFLLSAFAFVIQLGMSLLLVRKNGNPNVGVERMSLAFSNNGYIGIPLVQGVFGAEGVIYMTMFVTVFNIVLWTVGVLFMTGKTSFRQAVKNLCSPAIFMVLLGLAFFFFRISLPEIILQPLESVGNMNTPFAMLIAGATLAGSNLLGCVKKPKLYLLSAAKLLLIPILTVLAMAGFVRLGVDSMLITITVIAVACPTAAACTMFAHRYQKDSAYASELFAITTILSAATIPAVIWLLNVLLKLLAV